MFKYQFDCESAAEALSLAVPCQAGQYVETISDSANVRMKRLLLVLDRLICGKAAAALALIGALLLLVIWLQPLPWRHFPNVVRIFSASWLYLALSVSIAYSAAAIIAKRQGTATDMWTCLIVGAVWKFTPLLAFLPFNFSRLLIIYGLAGVVAHCIRRSRSSAAPPTVVASLPAKQIEPDLSIQPEQKTWSRPE